MPADSARRRGLAVASALPRLTATAAALLMAGCGSASAGSPRPRPPGAVTIARDDANGTTVRLDVGDRLKLTLASSYWHMHASPAPAVLRQDGPARLLPRPSTCPDIPGIGCTPIQTLFTALAPGTAVITATRHTCGEALACAADQRRFTIKVVIR
jgi:predicted acyl esterase